MNVLYILNILLYYVFEFMEIYSTALKQVYFKVSAQNYYLQYLMAGPCPSVAVRVQLQAQPQSRQTKH